MTGEANGSLNVYISALMSRCDDAIEGKLSESEEQELIDQIVGGFGREQGVWRQIRDASSARNFASLKGALGACHAMSPVSGNVMVKQEQHNEQAVNVDVSFAQVISNVMTLPSSELDAEGKAEIAAMLAELEEDQGDVREDKAMEVVRWLGDKGFEVVKAVAPTLLQAILGTV